MTLRAVGNRLQGYMENILAVDVTDSFQQTATRHGVDWNTGYDATSRYDNFLLVDLSPPIASVSITPDPLSVMVGGADVAAVQAIAASGAQIPPGAVTWSTGNSAIATVSGTGATAVVTGVSAGFTSVIATAANGVSSSAMVTVTAPADNWLLNDGFSGTSGTPLANHTPDLNRTAHPWVITGATPAPTIQNGLAAIAGGSGHVQATVDAGVSDIQVAADYKAGSGAGMGAIVFRLTDENNYFILETHLNTLCLYRRASGTWTQLASQAIAPIVPGSTHRIQVRAVGQSIWGFWDGVGVLSATDAFQQNATRHGLDWNSAYDPTAGYHNVLFIDMTPAPPTVASVVVSPDPVGVNIGFSRSVSAVAKDASNAPIPNVSFTWQTGNTAIATVSGSGSAATVTGVATGTTTLTATAPNTVATTVTVNVTAVPSTWLVSDSFTGADGTALSSHAPDVNRTSGAWTWIGLTPMPTIQGNRAAVGAGGGHVQAAIDAGVSDIDIAVDYIAGSGPGMGGIVFRLTDTNDFLILETYLSSLCLYRRAAGAWTLLASQPVPAIASGSTHRLEIRAVGSTISGYWDNTLTLQASDTFQQTATRHGLDWNSAYDATTTYDNFLLIDATPAPAVVASVTVAPDPITVSMAATSTATATAKDAAGAVIPNVAFTWSTANSAIAAVSGTTGTAIVTGVTAGSTTVTATAPNGVAATATVNVSAVPGTWVVSDTFTAADGIAIAAHAADVNRSGQPWTITGSSPAPTIQGGRAAIANGGGHVQATIDTAVSDVTVAVDYRAGGGPGMGAVVFRLTDANNFFVLETYLNTLCLYRRAAGAWTLVASQPIAAIAAGSTHRLEARAVGSTIRGYWDNALTLQATDSFQQTATRHGIDWNSAYDPTTTYDNLLIVDATAVPGPTVTLTPDPATVSLGGTLTVTATSLDASGNPVPYPFFTWMPGSSIIGVTGTGASVTVTGVTAGSTTLTCNDAMTGASATINVTVSSAPSSWVVSDTFTAVDGTALSSHAPDLNRTGKPWTITGATPAPVVQGGRAAVASGGGHLQATVDSGVSDIKLAVDYRAGSGPGMGAIVFRLTDASNFFVLETYLNTLCLYRRAGGTWILVASQPLATIAAGSTHRLEVRAVGSAISGYWDDVLTLQATDAFQQTATRHGIDWNSAYDATSTYDNLLLVDLTGSATWAQP